MLLDSIQSKVCARSILSTLDRCYRHFRHLSDRLVLLISEIASNRLILAPGFN